MHWNSYTKDNMVHHILRQEIQVDAWSKWGADLFEWNMKIEAPEQLSLRTSIQLKVEVLDTSDR